MSFLSAAAPAAGIAQVGQAIPVTGAARALGGAFGVEGSRIGEIAGRVGDVANRFADIGGAERGYTGRAMNSELEARIAALRGGLPGREINSGAEVENHMQKLDPTFIQRLMQQFGGAR